MDLSMVLDLFCGEGGASAGYKNDGYGIYGIDNDAKALKRYPYGSDCLDWREALDTYGASVDLIHASPVCKRYSTATRKDKRDQHPDQIAEVRDALRMLGKPYVIENVPGSPLIDPVELCGCMFGLCARRNGVLYSIYRPRLFEANFFIPQPEHVEHRGIALDVFGHGAPGRFYREHGHGVPAHFTKEVMGVPWMTRDGMSQSIPPVFAQHVGRAYRMVEYEFSRAA